ncbi:salicylate hydroxylase [Bimuria novae-zelandiae CBS 107.79]|uniref:Salicylate hydroxylase n=1 Tax=Bimuria novae-zelandiae CBS 107.79 TaxID=1447943 RepID=A0A6A5USZ0_9PLEO|nr:salicylate hydroxylase [Bimuria novae-zelandiae CBS 107.79]
MASSHPRIAIIGGGPAGLTAGLLLHKHDIPFTLFELRHKPTEEELSKPSGMLDLHEGSGIAAIKECGLYDELLMLMGECSEAQKVSDKHGNILYADEGELSNRPEISRHALINLLTSQLPADRIKWNHRLVSASSPSPSNPEVELDFASHGKQTFDLVIGADGAWSKVRSLLTDVRPHYAGWQIITVTMREVTTKYPYLDKLVGKGSFAALGDRHGVMSQRGSQDSARIYIFLTVDDEHFATTRHLAGETAARTKEQLLSDPALLGTWDPAINALVAVACDEEVADNPGSAVNIRPMYMLPIGYAWEHRTGATLVGDAAHLMPPAGQGVNVAMSDSLLLARAVVKAYETAGKDSASFQKALDPLLTEFEADMIARAKDEAEEALEINGMMFGEDGAKALAGFFSMALPPEQT